MIDLVQQSTTVPIENEYLAIGFHILQTVMTGTMLGFILRQHKIWTRMKDRLNTLWHHHCKVSGDEYSPLENGK